MKKMITAVLAVLLVLSLSLVSYARVVVRREETGNGYTEYYDDGSYLIYNARGDNYTFVDAHGHATQYDPEGGTFEYEVSDYPSDTGPAGNNKHTSKSSSTNEYIGDEITSAYWNYSNGTLTAHWNADHRSKATFTIILYRDGTRVQSKSSSGGSSINFTDIIANSGRTGNYYFVLRAKWPGGYSDETESDNFYVDSNRLNYMQNRSNGNYNTPGTSGNPNGGPGVANGPGSIAYGWQLQSNGTWKYLKPDGTYAANGWEYINNKWYAFYPNGIMRANEWILSAVNPHIWYYVGPQGDMLTNTTVNGWVINAAGECYY